MGGIRRLALAEKVDRSYRKVRFHQCKMRFAEGKGGEGSIILERKMRFRKITTRGLRNLWKKFNIFRAIGSPILEEEVHQQ